MRAEEQPRASYSAVIGELEGATTADLRELEERLDATLRELGIAFEVPSGDHHNTWFCDLLPQIFPSDEWNQIVRGFQQRFKAFDLFLEDVYGKREILRQGTIPIPVVLGSPNYQRSAAGLRPAGGHFLQLSGLCICRDVSGRLLVKNHYLSHASGLSYMIQNRRLLARVLPELFQSQPVESIADIPTEILLQAASGRGAAWTFRRPAYSRSRECRLLGTRISGQEDGDTAGGRRRFSGLG